ncbi:hepatic lectin-like isoform X1 [Protopterus annectens]|uniref:hepatic lectin-like isoform X1 n=1 Tax=Protopterus annectens TaxID=7888 RepID=UPI001CFB5935|nr:hepatic lectin-like isoform X1 [Protopterus annectens]
MERLQEELMGSGIGPRQARPFLYIYAFLAVSFILTIGLFIAVFTGPHHGPVSQPDSGNKTEFIALKQTADMLSSRENDLESRLGREVAQLNSKAAAASANIGTLETKVNTEILSLKNSVLELSSLITSISGSQNQLKQQVSQLPTSLDVQTNINQVKQEISSLKEELASFKLKDLGWKTFKNKQYFLTNNTLPWDQAKSWCESKGAKLAVITSQEQQDFIKSITNNNRYWIGLSDHVKEGDWHWIDGTDYKSNVKFWKPGEPNDSGDEDCAHIWTNGLWNDVPCSMKYTSICEKNA